MLISEVKNELLNHIIPFWDALNSYLCFLMLSLISSAYFIKLHDQDP